MMLNVGNAWLAKGRLSIRRDHKSQERAIVVEPCVSYLRRKVDFW